MPDGTQTPLAQSGDEGLFIDAKGLSLPDHALIHLRQSLPDGAKSVFVLSFEGQTRWGDRTSAVCATQGGLWYYLTVTWRAFGGLTCRKQTVTQATAKVLRDRAESASRAGIVAGPLGGLLSSPLF